MNPRTDQREAGELAMDWYTPYVVDNLAHGDDVLPPPGPNRICVASSHKLAVACWRYWELVHSQQLTYYRVQPYNHEGEPTPVNEIPGLFLCHTVKVIERVPDGSGYPEGERWPDEELWPLVKPTRWPHGSPIYSIQGSIVNQPNLTPASELDTQFVEALHGHRWLPFFIKSYVETHSTFRFGDGWPPWDWQAA
jgi:hypothetical protein